MTILEPRRESGVGLAFVPRLAALLRGEVQADCRDQCHAYSEYDQGAKFLHTTKHIPTLRGASTAFAKAFDCNSGAEKGQTDRHRRHRPCNREAVPFDNHVQDGKHGNQDGRFPEILADHFGCCLAFGAVRSGSERQRHTTADSTELAQHRQLGRRR
jgi:hypothetical protein